MGDYRVHHCRFFEYVPCAVHCLAYNELEDKLALSRSDGSVEIWNIKDNWLQEQILPAAEDNSVEALVWSGIRLFSAGLHGNLLEHDLLTSEIKCTVPSNNGAIWCVALNNDGNQIAAGTEDGCVVLFNILNDNVEYHRSLDKQEGRILCIAWYDKEQLIVTGGVDNIRIWSVHSGHAIQRMTLARQERNKENIVWAIAITDDFTIISGDSSGKTNFWNGRQGTLIKSFQAHKSDVLTLCVNKDGTSVFSAGIDPSLVQFEFIASNPNSDWKMWVRSLVRSQHTHDVRALTLTKNSVVSGGVDCQLIFNHLESKKGIKSWTRIAPIPQVSRVQSAKQIQSVLLQYSDYLELWRLGSTSRTSESSGEILQLKSNPIKLLNLRSRDGEQLVCSAISSSGQWLAYSDRHGIRLFELTLEELQENCPNVALSRIRFIPPGTLPAHCMRFAGDKLLVMASNDGGIQILRLDSLQPALIHTYTANVEPPARIHLLVTSPSGKYFATGDSCCNVHVYNTKSLKKVCSLPQYSYKPTAMGFHPESSQIFISYSDQKLFEYDIQNKRYTNWSCQLQTKYPPQWLKRHSQIMNVHYHPTQNHLIFLHDDQMFCIIDKTQPFPSQQDKLFNKSPMARDSFSKDVKHAFHTCSKYKYLLYLEPLEDDFLLAVERTHVSITNALPDPLKEKKFGT